MRENTFQKLIIIIIIIIIIIVVILHIKKKRKASYRLSNMIISFIFNSAQPKK